MSGNRQGQITNYVRQLGYDKFESRVYLGYANGTQTNYSYEPDRRRLQNMVVNTGNGNSRRIMDNTYTYDKVDNILSLTNNAPVPSSNLMGGSAQYSYGYDDLYRLTTASGLYKAPHEQDRYSMTMEYNTVGSLTRKTQTNDKSPNGNKWIPQKKTTYDLSYTYDAKQPHAATHIGRQTYTYDADGNQAGWTDDKTGQRQKMVWDEENRLRSVSVNGQLNSYVYDASGERVLKGKGAGQTVYMNGDLSGSSGGVGNFTVYVNPYLVVGSGEYSNHYFIENQRISTRLVHGWNQQVGAPNAGDSISWPKKEMQLVHGIARDQQALQGSDSSATAITGDHARDTAGAGGQAGSGTGTPWANANPDNNGNHYAYGHYKNADNSGSLVTPDFLYFYHPDHLGSTSFVTDGSGEVYQHLEYFAFGETFVEEHSNTERTPYLFNGKELDEETGLYYYGARYYDPRTSIWQSVDPLAEKTPGWSPYNYGFDNPVKYTDPDGRSGEPVINRRTKTITMTQHLIFYGGKANNTLSGKIATGVASQWNGAHGKVTINGVTYKVRFKVTYETVSEADARRMAASNTDIKNNFVRIEKVAPNFSSRTYGLGGNGVFFNTSDDIGGSTTPAHEIGHTLGLDHTNAAGQTRTSRPEIMEARFTQVHPRWSKVGPSNDIDPNFRRVSNREVQAVFGPNGANANFNAQGVGRIGVTSNHIFDATGH